MDVERALAHLAMLADGGPCQRHRTPDHVTPDGPHPAALGLLLGGPPAMLVGEIERRDTRTVLYMLLSLIFDLWRRNEYVYLALREFAPQANPEFSAMIAVHADLLSEYDRQDEICWDARAKYASAVLHRLLEDTEAEHLSLLHRVAEPKRETVERRERARLPRPSHTGALAAEANRLLFEAAYGGAAQAAGGGGGAGPTAAVGSVPLAVTLQPRNKNVDIVFQVPNSDLTDLWVDDQPALLDDKGNARVSLPPGLHSMHWRGIGAPSQPYRIEITSPPEAAWVPNPLKHAAADRYIDARHAFVVEA